MTARTMDDKKRETEIKRLLTFLYFEWGKPITPDLVRYWGQQLRGLSKDFVWNVARELTRRKTFGEPKFQDFWNLALTMSNRKPLLPPYNPWGSSKSVSTQYVLTDIPGHMTDAAGEVFKQLPAPAREGRRELSKGEKKFIEVLPNVKTIR